MDTSSRTLSKNSKSHRGEEIERPVWKVFVGGVPSMSHARDLHNYFSQFGPIKKVKTFKDSSSTKSNGEPRIRGFCHVETYSEETSRLILAFEGHSFLGRTLLCQELKKGRDLQEQNQQINQKRGLIKNVPVDLPVSVLAREIEKYAGPLEKLFPLQSGLDARKSSQKQFLTYSAFFADETKFGSFLAIGKITTLSKTPILVLPYTHKQKYQELHQHLPHQLQHRVEPPAGAMLKKAGSKVIRTMTSYRETVDETPKATNQKGGFIYGLENAVESPLGSFETTTKLFFWQEGKADKFPWSIRPTQKEYHRARKLGPSKTVGMQSAVTTRMPITESNYLFRISLSKEGRTSSHNKIADREPTGEQHASANTRRFPN